MWGPSLRWAAERSMWSVPNSLLWHSLLFRVWWIGWQKSKETWHIGHLTSHYANRSVSSLWNTICRHNSLTPLPGIGHRSGPTLWCDVGPLIHQNLPHVSQRGCVGHFGTDRVIPQGDPTRWPNKVITQDDPTRSPHKVIPQGDYTKSPHKVMPQGDPTKSPIRLGSRSELLAGDSAISTSQIWL